MGERPARLVQRHGWLHEIRERRRDFDGAQRPFIPRLSVPLEDAVWPVVLVDQIEEAAAGSVAKDRLVVRHDRLGQRVPVRSREEGQEEERRDFVPVRRSALVRVSVDGPS